MFEKDVQTNDMIKTHGSESFHRHFIQFNKKSCTRLKWGTEITITPFFFEMESLMWGAEMIKGIAWWPKPGNSWQVMTEDRYLNPCAGSTSSDHCKKRAYKPNNMLRALRERLESEWQFSLGGPGFEPGLPPPCTCVSVVFPCMCEFQSPRMCESLRVPTP